MAFTAAEESKLKRLHPDLVKVVRKADALGATFRVGETTRSVAQQKKNIANGVSWTMRSRHLPEKDGLARAVDLLCLLDGKVTWSWPPYRALAKVMFEAAKECGLVTDGGIVKMRWGGRWANTWEGPLSKQADGPHFELDRRWYP